MHQICISKGMGNGRTINIVDLMRGRERSEIGYQKNVIEELNRACLAARTETGRPELILLKGTGDPGNCRLLSATVSAFVRAHRQLTLTWICPPGTSAGSSPV